MRPTDHGRFRSALALARLEDGLTVVDWGCAHGWFASLLAERCPEARVIACDIPYPGGAPELGQAGVEYHVIDEAAPALPLRDGEVDRVFALDVLEHMGPASQRAALAEMRRVLARDGLLVVTVPHRGLLHWTDVENVRFRFPAIHRAVFSLLRGRGLYAQRYGANRLANFSADALEHHHYTAPELDDVLRGAGFGIRDRQYFGLAYAVPWVLAMLTEALRRATRRSSAPMLERLAGDLYVLAVDAKPPPRLAESLGVCACPVPSL
ncbi:MAG: class I SAM-dependent methyltransferase [Solirubrobacteraceae bacterium]